MTETARGSGTETTPNSGAPSTARTHSMAAPPEPTNWVGTIAFAGIMMVLLGSFHAIEGLMALFNDQYYLVGSNGLVVSANYTAWGWTHLILGVIVVGAGVALFSGRLWARAVAVGLALVSAIVNLAFIAAYPVWSTIMIGICVLVIWGVTVHGDEMQES